MRELALWLLLGVWCMRTTPTSSSTPCEEKDQCSCFQSSSLEREYQCPPNYPEVGGIIVHIHEKSRRLEVDCHNLEAFDVESLVPGINASSVEAVRVRLCPLAEDSLKRIFDRLSIRVFKLTHLLVWSSNLEGVVLNTSFAGAKELRVLSLRNNSLVYLDEDSFGDLNALEVLDLRENQVVLARDLFVHTPNLRILNLASNGMEGLPEGVFRNLRNLTALRLWNNRLKTLDSSTFEGLDSLKILEMSANQVSSISVESLSALKQLISINLTQNRLKKVPKDLFGQNKLLEQVRLENNLGLELPSGLFANLKKLKEVVLSGCNLSSLPEDTFSGSQNLETIELHNNRLTLIPQDLFKDLTNLKRLDLSRNLIIDLSSYFTSLKSLEVLNLQGNAIEKIGAEAFEGLVNLKDLDLGNNRISSVESGAFASNENLVRIKLSYNQLTLQKGVFETNFQLAHVDLSHNLIADIDGDLVLNKVDLRVLDLSYNKIEDLRFATLQTASTKQLSIHLDHNNITTVDFRLSPLLAPPAPLFARSVLGRSMSNSLVHLQDNPIQCDCHLFDLLKYLRDEMDPNLKTMVTIDASRLTCAGPGDLRGTPVKQLHPKELVCPLEAPESSCDRSWRPFDTALVVDCADRNLSEVPEMALPEVRFKYNQTEVHLEGNRLEAGPEEGAVGYANVTKLFLSHNRIREIAWVPPKIEMLTIDNNNITHLNYGVLKALNSSRLNLLKLAGNPWRCDCETTNFTNFIRQHSLQINTTNVFCNGTRLRLVDLSSSDLCREWQPAHLLLALALLLLTSAVLAALYYRHQQDIKIWLYAHDLCLWWVTEEELDKDKAFDAFISYSHKDEEFVVEQLLPVLEGGPHLYRLCLHYRHFVLGEYIQNSIVNSVNASRRTLVVLSPNFLESVWGKMEFRTAHTNAMKEGRARVIVLIYGEVDVEGLDEELKAYLRTNTYVKWGDPRFWDKLMYALPHAKRRFKQSKQRQRNVTRNIEEGQVMVKQDPLAFRPTRTEGAPRAETESLLVSTG